MRKIYVQAKSGESQTSEFALGKIYEEGNDFLLEDKQQAEHWYTLSAEKGYLHAQEALSSLYMQLAQKDLALKWSTKCAENGSASGQFFSAVLMLENPDQLDEAISMLKMSVKQDYVNAITLLGTLYLQGKYVEFNSEKGMKYLKRAIPSNDPVALHNLAIAYKKGMGTRPDMERALAYFELAKSSASSSKYPQLAKISTLGDEFIKYYS
jgi:TPR repeat protein